MPKVRRHNTLLFGWCIMPSNLLADLFLYSYESEFLQKLVKDKKIHEARAFNFTYRYIDDVLSINNSRFAEFLPLIYPPELEVKETTERFALFDLLKKFIFRYQDLVEIYSVSAETMINDAFSYSENV